MLVMYCILLRLTIVKSYYLKKASYLVKYGGYATLSSGTHWDIPRVTCIFSVYTRGFKAILASIPH